MNAGRLAVGLCLVLASLGRAQAMDGMGMSLEELGQVRILATPKFAANPDQVPSQVSILTADDIRVFGWRTLAEALRSLQGFNVTSDHTYSYAGARGISPPGDYRARQQILVDGLSLNENIYGSVAIDSAFPLDLGMVERIEVIRGPSAAVYGGDAMFGVINVVTRDARSLGGSEAGFSLGSGVDRQGRLSWGGELGGLEAVLSVSGFKANGKALTFRDLAVAGDSERLGGVDGGEGSQLFFKLRGSDWRFSLIHGERQANVPSGSYGTLIGDPDHVEKDLYSVMELAHDWRLDARNTLYQRLYAGRYQYDGRFPYDYSATTPFDPHVLNVDKARGSWWGVENRLSSRLLSGQQWTLGLEYRANNRQDQVNEDLGYGCVTAPGGPACMDDRRSSRQLTFYAQDEIDLGMATVLTLGMRHDDFGSLGRFNSPRLGLVHDAGEVGLFKFLAATAFQVPSVYQLAYVNYGNPDLEPEKVDSAELTWESRFLSTAKLTATLYGMRIRHLTGVDASGHAANGKPIDARGVELGYERQWESLARLRASYTAQVASTEDGRLDNSPRHMVKLNLSLPLAGPDWRAGFESQWVSSRLANAGSERVAPYLLTNLNLLHAPKGQPWEVAFGVYNLFDRRYDDPVSTDSLMSVPRSVMPQMGRTWRLQGRYCF